MKFSTARGVILLLILSAVIPSAVFDARQPTWRNREENLGMLTFSEGFV